LWCMTMHRHKATCARSRGAEAEHPISETVWVIASWVSRAIVSQGLAHDDKSCSWGVGR
jgi:hypothetical protein